MSVPATLARRLRNLGLDQPRFERAEDAVRWLGAAQSQDYGPAKWSVGERVAGATDAVIDNAFQRGAILRTHLLRPTWHFVTPDDIRWMLELTGPRVHGMNKGRYRDLELDGGVLTKAKSAITNALRDGAHLTRPEIVSVLATAGIEAAGQRLGYILMSAELDGQICSGEMKGKQHTHALLAERAPKAKRLDRDEALAELTLRYFRSHGPATEKDFRWWSSLTLAEIRRGLQIVRGQLECEEIDGRTYWSAEGESPAHAPRLHLLHGYDEYIVGYSESKFLLFAPDAASTRPGPSFNGVLFLDRQVAGLWRRRLKRDAIVAEIRLLREFGAPEMRALNAAGGKLGQFLGLRVELNVNGG